MEERTLDPGVFIRSMATRGSHGGLARAAVDACDVMDAFGFDEHPDRDRRRRPGRVRRRRRRRHGARRAVPGRGRRHPGDEGRPARGGRRARGQQGRPARAPTAWCSTSRRPSTCARPRATRAAGRRRSWRCSAASGDGVEGVLERRSPRTARTSRPAGSRSGAARRSALAAGAPRSCGERLADALCGARAAAARARAERLRDRTRALRCQRRDPAGDPAGVPRAHRDVPGERSVDERTTRRSDDGPVDARAQWEAAFAAADELRDDAFTTLSGAPLAAALRPGGRRRSTTSATSAGRASSRSRAACTRRCTAGACGRCASSRASAARGQTNERFKFLLEHGQTGLSTAFDFPTLMGYDSDHRAQPRRGRTGRRRDLEPRGHGDADRRDPDGARSRPR